jgi:hypothetical protein
VRVYADNNNNNNNNNNNDKNNNNKKKHILAIMGPLLDCNTWKFRLPFFDYLFHASWGGGGS